MTNSTLAVRFTKFLTKFIEPKKPPMKNKEPSSDIRNIMLVGAALIATVTFQAGISPPGGVWQNDDNKGHRAGHAIYSSQRIPFCLFLICNTIAVTASCFLLLLLTFGYPFFLEVLIATISMMATYTSAIYCVTPYESVSFRLIFLAALVPIVIRFSIWVFTPAYTSLKSKIPDWVKRLAPGKKETKQVIQS